MASSGKKKCRQYSCDYLQYGFVQSPSNAHLPLCLLCDKVFSNEAMKPSRLKEHFQTRHRDKVDKDITYFQNLREKQKKRLIVASVLPKSSKRDTDGMVASYNIAKMIVKCGKPHSIGEKLLIPVISEIMETVLHQNPSEVIKCVPLSNDTVRRRTDEMASDVEDKLCNTLQKTRFSLQVDESTLRDNQSVLLGYVRYTESNELREEPLFLLDLPKDTSGETIFATICQFFEKKSIPLINIVACATDGAPAMIGRHRGFIAFLKRKVPQIFTIHCVIHRQHLVAKQLSEELHVCLQIVINAVNLIKTRGLNGRLFRQLCHENDEEFERLLLHTQVRWLSRGKCLMRFYQLFDSIVEFLQGTDENLCQRVSSRRHDVAYLADILEKCNALNLQLQGDRVDLIKAKSVIMSFIAKLKLHYQNVSRREFFHFPCLSNHTDITDDQLLVYSSHIKSLQADMEIRFRDLLDMSFPDWISDPFSVCVKMCELPLQEKIVDLQSSPTTKSLFSNVGYARFWTHQQITSEFPLLSEKAKVFLLPFPSSYLVERGFSALSRLLSKYRNRLDVIVRGDLRLMLTNIEPDVVALVEKHQPQGSH